MKKPSRFDRRTRWRIKLLCKDPRCYYCQTPLLFGTSTIDHLIPRSKGGGERRENMVLSCMECNRDKADLMPDEFAKKVKVTP